MSTKDVSGYSPSGVVGVNEEKESQGVESRSEGKRTMRTLTSRTDLARP